MTVHELAHAVQNLGFSKEDRVNWSAIYDNARRINTFRGTFAMTNDNEYFAELSQSYFAVNSEIGGPEAIKGRDPDAFAFLEAVYSHGSRREVILKPGDAEKCDQEARVHSLNSDTRIEVTLISELDSTVNVYWIDFAGTRELYNKLAPNDRVDLATFLTHPWVITDTAGSCVALVLPQEDATTIVLEN